MAYAAVVSAPAVASAGALARAEPLAPRRQAAPAGRMPAMPPAPNICACWCVLDVTIASTDALRVRRAVAACTDAGVLRCVPRLGDRRVRLEIRLPASRCEELLQRLMCCVDGGEIGPFMPWRQHLARHGLAHGR